LGAIVNAKNQSEHILNLSRELLDDIELSRIDGEKLLLKCFRLARQAGSDEIQEWIELEMLGYRGSNPIAKKCMSLTGRWTNYEKKEGHYGPLAEHEASIKAYEAQLVALKLPNLSGHYIPEAISNIIRS
jgi:hypothetical protein